MSRQWSSFVPLGLLAPMAFARVELFCEEKRIVVAALEQLGTRATVNRRGGVVLAYPRHAPIGPGGALVVCGIRLRDLDPEVGKSAMPGSRFAPPALPAVVGDVRSRDWLAVEGETDAARLWLLTRGEAAVVCYGGTQAARYREWDAVYPPGARVFVAFDADRRLPGEPRGVMRGAEAAALLLARLPNARRVLPLGAKDWCEWERPS